MNTQQPEISIIIPNYNCMAYLPDCIAGIDAQKMSNLEIVFVDDGSTDGSRDYLLKLQSQRSDINVVLEQGAGPGKARNIGVQVAQGKYLAFLDADDTWLPGKLNDQLIYMEHNPDTVLTFTDYQHVSDEHPNGIVPCFSYWPEFKSLIERSGHATGYRQLNKATAELLKENVVGTSTVMCRRDAFIAVNGFDSELPSASDWDLWLKLSKIGHVGFTNEITMNYLMRSGSVSSNIGNRIQAMKIIAGRHLNDAKEQSANIKKFLDERLMDARCEKLQAEKKRLASIGAHLHAFLVYPNIRRVKALLKSVVV